MSRFVSFIATICFAVLFFASSANADDINTYDVEAKKLFEEKVVPKYKRWNAPALAAHFLFKDKKLGDEIIVRMEAVTFGVDRAPTVIKVEMKCIVSRGSTLPGVWKSASGYGEVDLSSDGKHYSVHLHDFFFEKTPASTIHGEIAADGKDFKIIKAVDNLRDFPEKEEAK